MFSLAHVKKIQRASGVGNDLDLSDEIDKMDKVEWVVTQETYDSLMSTGSLYDDGDDELLVYNSMLIKLTTVEQYLKTSKING